MKLKILATMIFLLIFSSVPSGKKELSCHEEIILILEKFNKEPYRHRNWWYPQAKIPYMDFLLVVAQSVPSEISFCKCLKAHTLMELGQKEEAIRILEAVPKEDRVEIMRKINLKTLN